MSKECKEELVSIIIPVYNTPKQFLEECLESIRKQRYKNIEVIIVDDLNNAVLEELGYIYNENEPVNLGRTLVLPPKYLDPIAPGEGMKLLRCEDTISIHHYSASWMGNKTRLKRRIIRIIGQENVSKIKQFCQRLKMG